MEARIPVIGHMFVGLATGFATRPAKPVEPARASRISLWKIWGSFTVFLAYAPDIFTQAFRFAGWRSAGLFFHSFLFAVAFPAALALILRVAVAPPGRVFLVALFSIAVHDALDIGQATDKVPFWPFSDHAISLRHFHVPSGLYNELFIFGGVFLLFIFVRGLFKRREGYPGFSETASPGLHHGISAADKFLIAFVAFTAVVTSVLRDTRERQLESARILVESGRYEEGVVLIDASERWPSPAKAGRIDYLRGIAALGTENREKAEAHLRSSFEADPSYLWVVIELAVFYAESPLPLADRSRLASPYLEILRKDFHDRKEAAETVARIEAIFSGGARRR